MRRFQYGVLIVGILGLLLAGCGGNGGGTPTTMMPEPEPEPTMTAVDLTDLPAVTIPADTTIAGRGDVDHWRRDPELSGRGRGVCLVAR